MTTTTHHIHLSEFVGELIVGAAALAFASPILLIAGYLIQILS